MSQDATVDFFPDAILCYGAIAFSRLYVVSGWLLNHAGTRTTEEARPQGHAP
ncbi:hypothetical protein [Halomonas sp. B23F22_10]|uniref:hypothetical protein n=1 Tax=Halomonas sp. B23F22_10 TaxID=3459515 RepID=UPI00373F215D